MTVPCAEGPGRRRRLRRRRRRRRRCRRGRRRRRCGVAVVAVAYQMKVQRGGTSQTTLSMLTTSLLPDDSGYARFARAALVRK